MGRELREVPADWEHPKRENGRYIPLIEGSFSQALSNWEFEEEQWKKGFVQSFGSGWKEKDDEHRGYRYEDWAGSKPEKDHYMPEWTDQEKTHIQLYESTSEGTPLSPVFAKEDFDKLCEWAAENATTFANFKATKGEWSKMLKAGFVFHKKGNTIFL
ncbi:hypothetical protein [Elizabethkingia anophelis]|uniref:hypothetical protein n=1 Tax=Elizabethkingia anophelis TaxID=1117645 RepID=UPI00320B8867